MTDFGDQRPLSRVELIVLARLSALKAPTQADIIRCLRQIGISFTGPDLKDCATATLAFLKARGLAADAPESPGAKQSATASGGKRAKRSAATSGGKRHGASKPRVPRSALTDAGRSELVEFCGLEAATWDEMRGRVLPALALGEEPGDAAADAALDSFDSVVAAWLRRDRTLGGAVSVDQLCDQVIAKALGMPPGRVTPEGIRAFALAKHCGIDSRAVFAGIAETFAQIEPARSTKKKVSTKKKPTRKKPDPRLMAVAADLAEKQLEVALTGKDRKEKMVRALVRHWVNQQDEADTAQRSAMPRPLSLQSVPTISEIPPTATIPPGAGVTDPLLIAVRDAIPMVGSNGRYGKENVFVSALWQQLARDRRLPQLSLDDFKHWLVSANRDQLLALARADLIDDMDGRLVEDSEIEDLGETFHFVIDRRVPLAVAGQMHHAR